MTTLAIKHDAKTCVGARDVAVRNPMYNRSRCKETDEHEADENPAKCKLVDG